MERGAKRSIVVVEKRTGAPAMVGSCDGRLEDAILNRKIREEADFYT